MPSATTEALEVQLPICLECQRVGKIPVGHYGGKEFCSGPIGHGHKKVRMKKATFRKVDDA